MTETFWGMAGADWALFGGAMAAVLGGIGSAIGITIASSTVSGIVTEEGSKFGKLLPIAAMPGTQGIYGFITAVLVLVFFGIFGGDVTLEGAAGFVFGTDVNLKNQTVPEYVESQLSIEEILDELIAPLGIPAVANVPVGHGKHMATMPLGATVRLDAGAKTLEVTEAAVV